MSLQLDRLKEVRESKGLSQRQLNNLCGFGESQIYRYEKGITEPSVSVLKIIANILHVSADYLIGLADQPQGQFGETLTPEERKLVDAYVAGDNATLLEMIAKRVRQAEDK